jgi:tRNA U34 5-methylaminomethyl-2-thiouridine-forming methyltransferase MnmC
MQRELIITEDGSHTIYLPEIDEHYHSVHGAIHESVHIYIGQGLLQCSSNPISILEIGFGTGLNAFLTFCYAQKQNLKINYFSLEKFPLNEKEYLNLNYPEAVFPENKGVFKQLHRVEWNEPVTISPFFTLQKAEVDLLDFDFSNHAPFDLVYYDAFAPNKQPEMWTDDILHKVAANVKKDGILVTYCAKGTVRRALTAAGFEMERFPGPAGKKEILRGKKTN